MLSELELENVFVNGKLNQSEKIAYFWLKEKFKYKSEDIKKNNKTPDFICSDKKRFEVKAIYGNSLVFTKEQIPSLSKKDYIIAVDCGQNKVIDCFLWEKKDKTKWNISISDQKDKYSAVKLKPDTVEKLKKIKPLIELENKISFNCINDVIEYLISYRTKEHFDIEQFKI